MQIQMKERGNVLCSLQGCGGCGMPGHDSFIACCQCLRSKPAVSFEDLPGHYSTESPQIENESVM